MTISQDSQPFDSLPRFDARDFQPPAWASSSKFAWGQEKNGESSQTGLNGHVEPQNSKRESDALGDGDESEEEEVWEDATEGIDPVSPEEAAFTTSELKDLVGKADTYKSKGNGFFTSRPPDYEQAISSYKSALDHLPPVPKKQHAAKPTTTNEGAGGIQELTEEEAEAILLEEEKAKTEEVDPAVKEKEDTDDEIRECTKACWGNLAACYIATNNDKEAAEACTKALEVDPHYAKALQRRATANERIGTWSALTSAQEDYSLLLNLLPASSPQVAQARRALTTLPNRIRVQQEKEKDEMLGKLKELGNGLLGKFGLSTDMFKFDQQEGGGYNMRFER